MATAKQRRCSIKSPTRERVHDDKVRMIENMLRVIKSEQYRLLTDFMYLSVEDLDVYVDVTSRGEYVFTVRAVTDRLIDIGRALD